MAEEEFPREDELESRQDAALYPVGRVLRATFDAENHDSLGNDLTGLMLELARIDPDGAPLQRGPLPVETTEPVQPLPVPEPSAPPRAPWWQAVLAWLRSLMGRPATR